MDWHNEPGYARAMLDLPRAGENVVLSTGYMDLRVLEDPGERGHWVVIVRPQFEWMETIIGTEEQAKLRALAIVRQAHADLGAALAREDKKAGAAPAG